MHAVIDISTYQKNVDYKKLKASGINHIILRENDYNGGKLGGLDNMFEAHVKGSKEAGIEIHGIYHFGYEYNCEDVRAAARLAVERAEAAGIPKSAYIWCDYEYDSVDKAKARGIILGRADINVFTITFCEAVKESGYKTGIYCNNDWYQNWYYPETIARYPIWLADYTGGPDHSCLMQQTGYEKVAGITGDVDYNVCWCLEDEETETDPVRSRSEFVRIMKSWIGKNEADGSHRSVIDIYNSYLPHPRGYKVQYSDQWCATTVSAAAIALGYTDIIPVECGCPQMVEIAQKMGRWTENDDYLASPGDIILYDWQDSGSGDNAGWPDHIGVVEKVENGIFTVIEGNYKDSVARREIAVNGRYIRGFIVPKFTDNELQQETTKAEPVTNLVKDAQIHLNNFIRAGLVTDGERGPLTNKASRKAVQFALNKDFNASLTTDGIIGKQSKNALKRVVVKFGSTGYIVTALQILLTLEGYVVNVQSPGTADVSLIAAVKDYQSKHALEVDGEAGYNTFMSLLS